jgi:hypothetical protein
MGLDKVLRPHPNDVDGDNLSDIQDQTMSTVVMYLKPSVFKQMEEVFHQDKETIMYNKVVTVLLTDNMQQKVLVFFHASSGQPPQHLVP